MVRLAEASPAIPAELDQARRALRKARADARWWSRQLNPSRTARPPAASRQLPYSWNGPPSDPQRYLRRDDALRRAIRAWRKSEGWKGPAWAVPQVHNDRLYIAILGSPPPPYGPPIGAFRWYDGVSQTVAGIPWDVLAVYRVHRDGRLRRLRSRPPWLSKWHPHREAAAISLREIWL